jgi:beta-glucosidase
MDAVPARPQPALPPGFRIGAATSAFQIEGAAEAGGRGPSIWDGVLGRDGTSGLDGAHHHGRYVEDVALLRDLGVRDYRFSISWPRVVPHGRGLPSAAGLDFYDRLVDELCAAGIAPMATLYQWDLPLTLEEDGGWLNRSTVDHFADYAAVVADRLADRVAHWVPVDQPNVHMLLGYAVGTHAPGRRLMLDAVPAAHHLLLAHGRAAVALRAAGATSVGCANHHAPMWPATEDEADVAATKLFDSLWNGLFLEPMLLGRHPVDLEPLLEGVVREGDLATIRQPLDFYGVTWSSPLRVGLAPEESELFFQLYDLVGYPDTDSGWPVVPDALREWLITFRARYRAALPPLVVTGCGAAYGGEPDDHGQVDDTARIDYLRAHLDAVSTACQRGVDVRALYVWSFLDSFEWVEGFTQRFGLVHVDPATGRRTPKASYHWLQELIATQTRSVG